MSDMQIISGDMNLIQGDMTILGYDQGGYGHADILRMLFPLEMGENFNADVDLEGYYLDQAAEALDLLIENMFPDTAEQLLANWERVLDITPETVATTAERQAEITARIKARGGLSKAYFTSLAAQYGCEIEIVEYRPAMMGYARIGDPLYIPEIIWCWEVRFTDTTGGSPEKVEAMITRLKPAHTYVYFTYP